MYKEMIDILKAELVPALGCTEPIAIAYTCARARQILGMMPEELFIECSANIIKNAKSVIVPMTKNLKGIEAAAIVGMIGGDADKQLEVLTTVTEDDLVLTRSLLEAEFCKVGLLQTDEKLHIIAHMRCKEETVMVEVLKTQTGKTI